MLSTPKRSALLSWLLHCGAILLILAVTDVKPQILTRLHDVLVMPVDLAAYKTSVKLGGGGGGGGVRAATPASRGQLPRFAREQIVPPAVKIETIPILPVEPTLIGDPNIKLASFDYKVWGDPNGIAGPPSGGPGRGGGIGNGVGTGVGPGDGPGYGPGKNGGTGGGVGYLGAGGGAVTQPSLISKTEPEYSEDARKARLQGTVLLRIEVNTSGRAQNIVVSQSLGLGLDDRAVEAVKKWKFLPGKVNGKPATVTAYVEVNFRLL